VLGLLARQRDLYCQLKALSDQQGAMIAQGQAEQLLTLLAQRQSIVDELGELSIEISPVRSQIDAIMQAAQGEAATQIRSLVEEVKGLLESIIAQDDRGQEDLRQSRQEVSSQLTQVTGATSAVNAYSAAGAAKSSPRFTDHKG